MTPHKTRTGAVKEERLFDGKAVEISLGLVSGSRDGDSGCLWESSDTVTSGMWECNKGAGFQVVCWLGEKEEERFHPG